ncbi:MAG: endolytic transglycosylase MltG, partial [Deltaproteobacteria bacterium]
VEEETGSPDDRPRVAAVFWNRLRDPAFTPRLLQTDPTIVYGCRVAHPPSCPDTPRGGGHVAITRAMLDDPGNPYNTYRHVGLPPGPITNPGLAALEATLAPAAIRALYFVATGSGHSAFANTRAEHEANVQRYLRGRGGDAGISP